MAYEEIRGNFHPLGPDQPIEVERKLNSTGSALAALYPGVNWVPVRLTYSSFNGGLDSPYMVQVKLNNLFTQVAAAQGVQPPAPVALTAASAPLSLMGGAPAARPVNAASALLQDTVAAMVNRAVAQSAVIATAPPPANTTLPAVSGTLLAGQVLAATTGAWSGAPTSYAYQWLREGTPISGATGSTYTLQTADNGTAVSVRITATNQTGNASATSATVAVPMPMFQRATFFATPFFGVAA